LVLERAGYEVVEATDGERAIRTLGETRADLVITDMVMPEREGVETIQAIRKDHPEVGIIAISGAGGGAYLRLACPLGADAALMKPVSSEVLLAEVARVLGISRTGDSSPTPQT
jgi:DNA-binding response OmpR family regulator